MMILITGGAASGKSELAERASVLLNTGKKAYIATMLSGDGESLARIEKHRTMRSGKGFATLEASLAMPKTEALTGYDTVLVECVSNFLANVMFQSGKEASEAVCFILSELSGLRLKVSNTVIVTNEVFSDGGHYDEFTLAYIGALGRINRELARKADIVIESVCGIPLFMKGGLEGL